MAEKVVCFKDMTKVTIHHTTFDEMVAKAKGVKEVFVVIMESKETIDGINPFSTSYLCATFSKEDAERYIRSEPWGPNFTYKYLPLRILNPDGFDFENVEEMEEDKNADF